MPQPTPSELVNFLVILAFLVTLIGGAVGIIVGLRKLFDEVRTSEQEKVKRSEFTELERRTERSATKEELQELKAVIEKQEAYMRQRFHDLANSLGPIPTQIGIVMKNQDKLEQKLDAQVLQVQRLVLMLNTHYSVSKDLPPAQEPSP